MRFRQNLQLRVWGRLFVFFNFFAFLLTNYLKIRGGMGDPMSYPLPPSPPGWMLIWDLIKKVLLLRIPFGYFYLQCKCVNNGRKFMFIVLLCLLRCVVVFTSCALWPETKKLFSKEIQRTLDVLYFPNQTLEFKCFGEVGVLKPIRLQLITLN